MTSVISTHSFKGGPGKSTISANLASTLAMMGKRVGIVDSDLSGPGLHVMMGIDPEKVQYTVNDALMMRCSPEEAAIDLTKDLKIKGGSLIFLPASVKAEDIIKILTKGYEVSIYRSVVNKISEAFNLDYIFLDSRPGVEQATLISMGVCDMILMMTRLDNQDIFGTGVIVEIANALKKPTRIILNQMPSGLDSTVISQKISNMFGLPVAAVIPFYTALLKFLSGGIFVLENPKHEFSSTISNLAQLIDKELNVNERK